MFHYANYLKTIQKNISEALKEDIGRGDLTSKACIPSKKKVLSRLKIKDNGIIAGIEWANIFYTYIDKSITFRPFLNDGDEVSKGQIAFEVEGDAMQILQTERVVLNTMQRMSGIATKTKKTVEKLKGLDVKLLDTRKTTPGMRVLEKWAVNIGGGHNHRMGLYDAIMIKDNHSTICGGVNFAIEKVHRFIKEKKRKVPIIVEARSIEEIKNIIQYPTISRILIDNFSIIETKKAVKLIDKKIPIEASGNITVKNIRNIAKTGVDYLSCGEITHSAVNFDLSLKICLLKKN